MLDLLRADREACGPGVSRSDIARIAATRWPEGVIRKLRSRRYVIGESEGHYKLGHAEPAVERTTDYAALPSAAAEVAQTPADAPAVGGSLSDGQLNLFAQRFLREAA